MSFSSKRDDNNVPAVFGVSSVDGVTPVAIKVNPANGAMLIDGPSLYTGLDARYLRISNNLSDLNSASAARTNLGLGSAAVQNTSFFLQTANNLSDLASASSARGNLGLGTIVTQNANNVSISGGSISGLSSFVVNGSAAFGSGNSINSQSIVDIAQTVTISGSDIYGLRSAPTTTAAFASNVLQGLFFQPSTNHTSGVANAVMGMQGDVRNSNNGTLSDGYGAYIAVENISGGTITRARGAYFFVNNFGAGTITTGYGLYIAKPGNGGGGTFGTTYGLYMEDQNVGSINSYAIFTNAGKVHHGDTVYIPYGSYLSIDDTQNWPSGTHKLIGVTFTSTDRVDIYTPGSVSATPMISMGADQTISFFNASLASKQTSGANLTNNMTSGGTTDQIDTWTNLTTYATDAAAIRNAVYQLARKLKQVNDALRTYGLLT